ncbi:MAG: hypothetical protein U1F11_14970 [Steroidobacteraceae bacterium]
MMLGLKPGRPEQVGERMPLLTLLRAASRRPPSAHRARLCRLVRRARADLVIVALFLSLWVTNAAMADGASAADATAKQGALFGIVQGCAMLWAPLFGWLADRVDRVTLVIVATVLSIAGYGWMGYTADLPRAAPPSAPRPCSASARRAASSPRRCSSARKPSARCAAR